MIMSTEPKKDIFLSMFLIFEISVLASNETQRAQRIKCFSTQNGIRSSTGRISIAIVLYGRSSVMVSVKLQLSGLNGIKLH